MRLTIKTSFILLVVACACNNSSKLSLPVIDFSHNNLSEEDNPIICMFKFK